MPKRSSVETPNTLLKYFGKSPAASNNIKKEKCSPEKKGKPNKSPDKKRRPVKRDLNGSDYSGSENANSSDEEIKFKNKKRRLIKPLESESESTDDERTKDLDKSTDKSKKPVKHEKLSPVKNEKLSPGKNKKLSPDKNEKLSIFKREKLSPVKNKKLSPGKNEKESPNKNDKQSSGKNDKQSSGKNDKLSSSGKNEKPSPPIKDMKNSSVIQKIKENGSGDVNFIADLPEESCSAIDEVQVWPHNKLNFLQPENIKDKKNRSPNHPDYNPSTLYVPSKYLATLSPAVRQWWEMKIDNFDCVLFFKVGKFYELYHMDADVGVKELGFTYMKGEFAHSGFPEVSYDKMATVLVERGYKIARVEQTETPEMMTERCKKISATKFDRVVRREICQISNRGSQIYTGQTQVTYKHEPNYMLSIIEKNKGATSQYGICFIDTSIGDFYLSQFEDDNNCSRFLTLLAHNTPALVLHERISGITQRTQQIFKSLLANTLKESLTDQQFWDAEKTLKHLSENYFKKDGNTEWPDVIKLMQDEGDHLGLTAKENYKLAFKALGGCICYMKKCLIDEQVLYMARYNIYLPPDVLNKENLDSLLKNANEEKRRIPKIGHMVLDSITLSNLRITGEEHSLISTLDKCCTKFGKRLLHQWVCAPSCNVEEIKARQSAISELLTNDCDLQEARGLFSPLPDFERYLAQIQGFGNGKRLKNHPDGRAILFEESSYNKKKIQTFISILRGFETLLSIPAMFKNVSSDLLVQLTQLAPNGLYPEMKEVLAFFKDAFDHEEAYKEGIIAPQRGVDSEYDSCQEEIEKINKELKDYLIGQEKFFGCRISYFGHDKKRFQLEIPESNSRKAGSDYVLEGQRKGSKPVRRFHTAETKEFLKSMIRAEDQLNNVLKDLARRIFDKFSQHYNLWKKCVDSIATLDVLGSLAEYAKNQNDICIPEIIENTDKPFIELEEGFHPCMTALDNYIPNGIELGGNNAAPLALLTGPNMGGKSTLMRQIGLLAVMVQIGAPIPAKSCKMSLIDRIFTRLGAQDDIMAGHSTFLVELNETSTILKHATVDSLVLLDELGRGTATYDGTAIAASVVNFLAEVKCRTLFSTHYHNLVDYFQRDNRISLGHMACMVENEDSEDPTQETVTFLYKYASGACPKSYGFNAAKLAGMPHSVIRRAYELSKKVESNALKRKIISKVLNTESKLTEINDLLAKLTAFNLA